MERGQERRDSGQETAPRPRGATVPSALVQLCCPFLQSTSEHPSCPFSSWPAEPLEDPLSGFSVPQKEASAQPLRFGFSETTSWPHPNHRQASPPPVLPQEKAATQTNKGPSPWGEEVTHQCKDENQRFPREGPFRPQVSTQADHVVRTSLRTYLLLYESCPPRVLIGRSLHPALSCLHQ